MKLTTEGDCNATPHIYGYPLSDLELIGDSYYLFETGEYVGDKLPDTFAISDDASLEWVMEKLFNAEADEQAEADKIADLIKAYEGRRKKKAARVEWIRARFSAEIEAYAKTKLGTKTKYVDTPFGRIAWRTVKGGLAVTDKAKALDYVKAECWSNAIKVSEEFQISKLTDEQRDALLAEPKAGFEVKEDSEVCTIKTVARR